MYGRLTAPSLALYTGNFESKQILTVMSMWCMRSCDRLLSPTHKRDCPPLFPLIPTLKRATHSPPYPVMPTTACDIQPDEVHLACATTLRQANNLIINGDTLTDKLQDDIGKKKQKTANLLMLKRGPHTSLRM